jgi:acetyl-CoA carboxylase carboxyltransferase component
MQVSVLDTAVDHRTQSYLEARAAMLGALASLETALDAAREGGGERAVTRHHARGKLLARERIELLVDRDSPLLELSPVAGWGTGAPIGAAVVTAIGVVEDQACLIVASDPTVPSGIGTLQKIRRAQQIARENRLPLISLAEGAAFEPGSAPGADHPAMHRQAGLVAAGFARLAAARIPTAGVFFGQPPVGAGSGPFDYTIATRSAGNGAPAGSPGSATGPPAGLADHLAEDERDALRQARQCALRFRRPPGLRPPRPAASPKHDPEDLLAVPATDPWEILARLLDGSEFDEVQPGYGPALCAGWGELHGYQVAVLANAAGVARDEEAQKAARLVQLAAGAGAPLVILQQGSGPVRRSEAAMAGVVAEAGLPLVTVRVGDRYGLPALPALARFRFAWPHAHAGAAPVPPPATGPDSGYESSALDLSGRLDDDGVIDPRDTRTVLGLCLAVIRS